MNKKAVLYWLPRILAIIFSIFLAIFSFDVFETDASLIEKIGGFIIHNIPVFILIIVLIIAWKNEKLGGIIFIIVGLLFTIFFGTYGKIVSFMLISFPALLIGFLFLINEKSK